MDGESTKSVRQWIDAGWRLLRGGRTADPPAHPFDLRYGVDTGGLFYADVLATGHAHDRHSEGYYGTAPSVFRELMARWQETLTPWRIDDYTLIDLGCGKGRVLLMATEYPLRAIAGVELHPELALVAQKNLARWKCGARTCQNVTILNQDVLAIDLTDGPVVLYLFNSFDRDMVRCLLDRLAESVRMRSAPIDLLYVHPDHADLVEHTSGIELLADMVITFSEEDARADVFEVKFDRCCIYRLRGKLES